MPALGSLALDPLLSLIDTAFVGRLGPSALAGTAIATIVLNVSFSIFNFLSISITPLVANSLHQSNNASPITATALILALILGSFSMTIMLSFAPQICQTLGATAGALPNAISYLRIRAMAAPFALATFVLNGAFRGFKDLKTPFAIAVIANSTNVILDLLLIPSLKVAGAALATSLSQVLALILMLTALISTKRLSPLDLIRPPPLRTVFPLLSAGAMLTIRTCSILVTIAYATATASLRGVVQLAGYELCRQLWVFKATILDSFAAAAQVLVATSLAQNNISRARLISTRTIYLSFVFGLFLSTLALISNLSLPALFSCTPAVVTTARDCIRVAAICAPLNGVVFALDGILAACEDYRYMAGAIAAASFVSCMCLWAVRHWGGGVVWVWACLNVLMVARGVVLGVRFWGRGVMNDTKS